MTTKSDDASMASITLFRDKTKQNPTSVNRSINESEASIQHKLVVYHDLSRHNYILQMIDSMDSIPKGNCICFLSTLHKTWEQWKVSKFPEKKQSLKVIFAHNY